MENKIKDLSAIKQIVQEDKPLTWDQAETMAKKGSCIRRVTWPDNEFIFYRTANRKVVHPGSDTGFYAPISKEFLQKMGVGSLLISSHWNKYTNGHLEVGYYVKKPDTKVDDWVVYIP